MFFVPISGGYFISQIAQISMILEARNGRQPDAYFAASGGNIASMVSLCYTLNRESLLKVATRIVSEFFVKDFLQGKMKLLDNPVLGINCYEGLKKPGKGSDDFFKNILSEETIQNSPEVWTLIYNDTSLRGEVTCTKSKDYSIFSNLKQDYISKLGCGDIHYLNNDLDLISKATLASATLPGVREKIKIWDNNYVDGGLCAATPGSFFTESLYTYYSENTKPLHYFYFTSVNLENEFSRELYIKGNKKKLNENEQHWLLNLKNQIKILPLSSILADKRCLLENWLRLVEISACQTTEKTYKYVTSAKLKEILDEIEENDYFMEIFSEEGCVDILNFNDQNIIEEYYKAANSLELRIIIKNS